MKRDGPRSKYFRARNALLQLCIELEANVASPRVAAKRIRSIVLKEFGPVRDAAPQEQTNGQR
jgi:hypothetical protein